MFDPASLSLRGARALVTGGAAGIGAAIATALAASGADVCVTAHSRPADETLASIRALGRMAEALSVDLGAMSEAAAADLVSDAAARLGGGLDILVNNAGIIRRAEAIDHAWSDWREVMAVNLDAVWLLSQAAARTMAPRGNGRIINIASVLSFQGGVRVPGYAAAKHAVAGLTKALANEWAGQGITVNAIAPGYVVTENNRALREDPERMRELLSRIPAGRFAEPDEIAGAAVFLASPAASYVNGSVLVVDGGWLAR
ncbi:MAG: SDR family oxidoreductase [Rhizobiales bacterium]|nr:SDR family oxidoreductase [Hyphomicrobiales bacterium]